MEFFRTPQIEAVDTKDAGSPSAGTPAGASATTKKTDKPTDEASTVTTGNTDKPALKAPPGDTTKDNKEDERAAFLRLQASVAENAQVCQQYFRRAPTFGSVTSIAAFDIFIMYRVSFSGTV